MGPASVQTFSGSPLKGTSVEGEEEKMTNNRLGRLLTQVGAARVLHCCTTHKTLRNCENLNFEFDIRVRLYT